MKDISIDSNDILNMFLNRFIQFLTSNFGAQEYFQKVVILAKIYKSGLRDILDVILEQNQKTINYEEVEKIIIARFENTEMR